MAHGAYLHPLRTIEVAWERDDDGVVVLTGYRDQPPSDLADPGSVVVVHSDQTLSHRFPDADGTHSRALAERNAFLPEADETTHRLAEVRASGTSFGQPWTTLLAYPAVDHALTLSDIEADLRAMRLEGPTMFIGRRGATWWVGAQKDSVIHLDRQPHPETTSVAVFLHELLDELLGQSGLPSRTLTVFGDQLTPEILKDIALFTKGRVDGVERFNPFKNVRSTLNDAASSAILNRAHLLGCLIGAIDLERFAALEDQTA